MSCAAWWRRLSDRLPARAGHFAGLLLHDCSGVAQHMHSAGFNGSLFFRTIRMWRQIGSAPASHLPHSLGVSPRMELNGNIDTTFDFRSDTPPGGDPDVLSP